MASGLKTITLNAAGKPKRISFFVVWQEDLSGIISSLKQDYTTYRLLSTTDGSMNKISHQITLDEAKKYVAGNEKVLLYDLSVNYDRRELNCGDSSACKVVGDGKVYTITDPVIESHDGFLYVTVGENVLSPAIVSVSAANGGMVKVTNYERTSYAKNPRNTFRGSLTFQKDKIKSSSAS